MTARYWFQLHRNACFPTNRSTIAICPFNRVNHSKVTRWAVPIGISHALIQNGRRWGWSDRCLRGTWLRSIMPATLCWPFYRIHRLHQAVRRNRQGIRAVPVLSHRPSFQWCQARWRAACPSLSPLLFHQQWMYCRCPPLLHRQCHRRRRPGVCVAVDRSQQLPEK